MFCARDGLIENQATPQVFIFTSQTSCETRTTSCAESCLRPQRKRNLLHTDFRLLKCHFLSLRHDGVCCCVSGMVGWRSYTYRGTDATVVLSRTWCLLEKQIRHRWGVWQEKDMATRWEKKIKPNSWHTLLKCVLSKRHEM